jgi:hypothetical protein
VKHTPTHTLSVPWVYSCFPVCLATVSCFLACDWKTFLLSPACSESAFVPHRSANLPSVSQISRITSSTKKIQSLANPSIDIARWPGSSGTGFGPSPRTGGWCSWRPCGCSPWPGRRTSSAPSRRCSRRGSATTSGRWRRSASPRTSAAAWASSPARSRPRARRGCCSSPAPRRTPSATARSGSSSPGGRRRCPCGWYGELQYNWPDATCRTQTLALLSGVTPWDRD